jgi:hypothetical protein
MNGVTIDHDRCHREKRQEKVGVERDGYNETWIKIVMSGLWPGRAEARYEGRMGW